MSLWLGTLLILLNVALILTRLRAGVALYVTLALLVPHPSIGGTAVAYEILALPAVLLAVGVRRPRLEYPRFHLYLALFLIVMTLSTILGTTRYGSELDVIRFQGVIRFLVILALIRELLHRRHLEGVLLATVSVNAVIGLTQLLVPGLADTFLRLYGRTGQVALETYALADFLPRASGTFSSPVVLGSLALFALAVAWGGLLSGTRGRRHGWLLFSAGIAGMVSLTKTFMVGAPVVLGGGLVLSMILGGSRALRIRPHNIVLVAGVGAIAAALAIRLGAFLQSQGFYVLYYAAFLADPRAALATRYGSEGSVRDALEVVLDNPLVGVGITRVRGEFIGDSMYTLLLHSSGLAGTLLALGGVAFLLVAIRKRRTPMDLLLLGALSLAGLALPIVFTPGAVAIGYLLAPDACTAPASDRTRVSPRAAALPAPTLAGRWNR